MLGYNVAAGSGITSVSIGGTTYYAGGGTSSGSSGHDHSSCYGSNGEYYYLLDDPLNPPHKHQQKMASNCPEQTTPSGYVPINTVAEKITYLKSLLVLNRYQLLFLTANPDILNLIYSNLLNSEATDQAKAIAISIIDGMRLNSDQKLDINASFKSPFNIDRLSINDATPEGKKFNSIYDEGLAKSPEFQKLFIDLFGSNTRYNVKFVIADNLPRPKKPNEQDNGQTVLTPNSTNITIKINKQILTTVTGGITNLSKMAIAKVILHECIHAYLHIKGMYPNAGISIPGIEEMDLQKVINAIYGNNSDQHTFMYDHMIKTMENILSQLKDKLTTYERRNELINLKIYTKVDNTAFEIWNWDNYYKYLSLSGLGEAKSFITDYPVNSDALYKLNNYNGFGEIYLDKN